MNDVTSRTLHLLSLLQSRAVWSGTELAEELGVTARSVRRDVDRLRRMGYPVLASTGHGGGYQLGAGRALPPLLLERDEAVAVSVGLRLAAASGIDGLGEHALRALTALDQILPPTVSAEVGALTGVLDVVTSRPSSVAPPTLVTVARAARDGVQLRIEYERRDGERSSRRLEPYRVLSVDGRWYLFAWDLDREDWRTFRLDRMLAARATTFRFAARTLPDVEAYVRESITVGPYATTITVRILRPLTDVAPHIPATIGTLTPDGAAACILRVGGDDPRWLVLHLAHLGMPVELLDPPGLRDVVARLGQWFDQTRGGFDQARGAGGDSDDLEARTLDG